MGILGDIGEVIIGGVLGGPAGAISVFTVQHGAEAIEGSIDVARQIVKIGTDVYRAIPPEAFVLGGKPIHGLLKHEAEDELILLGYIAGDAVIFAALTWPLVGAFGVAPHLYVSGKLLVGKLVGKLHHRLLNDQEWEMAQYIFRDSLRDRDDIILTNIAGLAGRPFTYPLDPLGTPVLVNLGGKYEPHTTTSDGALLYHELTHVWQAKQRVLREIYLYDSHVLVTEGRDAYFFDSGRQWSEYNIEQQASIVEGWTLGATRRNALLPKPNDFFDKGARRRFAIGSPLFRYLNANVRRSDNGARAGTGRSVRQLLFEGGHRRMKDMHSGPPVAWWS